MNTIVATKPDTCAPKQLDLSNWCGALRKDSKLTAKDLLLHVHAAMDGGLPEVVPYFYEQGNPIAPLLAQQVEALRAASVSLIQTMMLADAYDTSAAA